MRSAAIIVILLFVGCLQSQVAKGPDTKTAQREVARYGLLPLGEWHYVKLKLSGGDKIFALKVERKDGELISYCLESLHEHPEIDLHGSPWDDRLLPFVECKNEYALFIARSVETAK